MYIKSVTRLPVRILGIETIAVEVCGCDLHCPYCQHAEAAGNSRMVCRNIDVRELVTSIVSGSGPSIAVYFTMCEPLLQVDELAFAARVLRRYGLLVFIKTHGFNPELLDKLLAEASVDGMVVPVRFPFEYWFHPVDLGRKVNLDRLLKTFEVAIERGVRDFTLEAPRLCGLGTDPDFVATLVDYLAARAKVNVLTLDIAKSGARCDKWGWARAKPVS